MGYAKDGTGKGALHPDQRVCEAIRLVFAKFRELWTVRQTFQWFRDHDVELPANPIHGTRLVWKIPSQSLVADILRNPFYAGAYGCFNNAVRANGYVASLPVQPIASTQSWRFRSCWNQGPGQYSPHLSHQEMTNIWAR